MSQFSRFSFSEWIFNSFQVSPEGLGLYRIFYGLFLLFFLLPSVSLFPFISALPSDFFMPPPGPMILFSGFPRFEILLTIYIALVLSTGGLILGFRTQWASFGAGILLFILKGFIYSVGKINHELLFMITPLLMAFSGWGNAYSLDAARGNGANKTHAWTLTLLALFIGFMFFTAGFSKIIGGWLEFDTQAAIAHFYKQYFVVGRQDFLADTAMTISSSVLWECMDYATVLFETGFLLAVFYARSTRIFICLAVLFHFSLMMILNISFLPNFVAYAAFLNWNKIDAFLKVPNASIQKWSVPLLFGLALILIFSVIKIVDNGNLLSQDWGLPAVIIVTAAVPIALYYLLRQGLLFFKRN